MHFYVIPYNIVGVIYKETVNTQIPTVFFVNNRHQTIVPLHFYKRIEFRFGYPLCREIRKRQLLSSEANLKLAGPVNNIITFSTIISSKDFDKEIWRQTSAFSLFYRF